MKKTQSLTALLTTMASKKSSKIDKEEYVDDMKDLIHKMVRIQQGIYHKKERVVIMFEGFDAAGKGGSIRTLTESLDPRGFKVIPIGAPTAEEQGKHWLYRFWVNLPAPGHIAIFDRSWYGRVLVEKVDKLTAPKKLARAYQEINQFEALLQNDGITVIKIFLAITKSEQRERFEARIDDPYKQWKINMDDINARKKWTSYVKAVDALLEKTDTKDCPWTVIPANSKKLTRKEVLKLVTSRLKVHETWMEKAASKYDKSKLKRLLAKI